MKHKKQRGQKRELNALIENMSNFTPFTDTDVRYEHFPVPSGQFISSPKTSGKVKTAFCRAWLEKTESIIKQKPSSLPFCKVVAIIDTGDLWESQIVVFYDKDYYDSFWTRDSVYQKWTPVQNTEKSFIRQRNIQTNLKEIAYTQTISEDDFHKESTLWFYGDI